MMASATGMNSFLQSLQRQQGYEHDDDDENARGYRFQDFANRTVHQVDQRSSFARFVLAEIADDVLDHDDQRVDQHADCDRKSAEAHQVG